MPSPAFDPNDRAAPLRDSARETADFHRRVIAAIEDYAIVTLDPTAHVLSWNAGAARIMGYAAEEIIDRHVAAFYSPEDVAAGLPANVVDAAARAGRFEDARWLVRKDGVRFWANVAITALRNDGGELTGFGMVARDLTERRRAEEALRASEARYERIAANVPGMLYQFIHGSDGSRGYTYVSDGARTLLGIEPAAALRDPAVLLDLIHPEDRPQFQALALATVFALSPFRWEGRVVLASGEERFVQIAAHGHRLPDGSIVSDGLVMDLTEMRRAAQRLEESEERYRSLFEHNPDGVYSVDAEGRFLSANPACEVVSGYTPDELLGQPFTSLIVPEDLDTAAAAFRTVAGGAATRFQIALRHRSGRRAELDVTGVPMIVGGRVVGVYGIAKDRTAQHELEGQLRQAQKLEALGQLAGGVAHDFNNILTVIRLHAQVGRAELDSAHPVSADLDEIERASARAAALTGQLLAFSRKQVLQPQVLDLNQVVEAGGAMLRSLLGGTVHLVTLAAPAPVLVYADRIQLEQVLMNLTVNARDAMPEGGTVSIEVAASPGVPPWAMLIVRDTGAGMSPDVQARAFEPFFTTKAVGKGTGLGLSTVHGIVQQSGGAIHVDSRPDAGTTFTVTLPLATPVASAPAPAMPATRGVPRRGAGTVLLAEDEEAVRAIARSVLERAGYTVLSARHGAEALRLLEEHRGAVDVLLSDVLMPEMSGIELARRAVARVPGIRVILMSGYTRGDIDEIAEDRSIDRFVPKPFTAELLVEAIQGAVDARRRGS